MSKQTGFIQLHRRIKDHWIWEDPIKLKWWLDILMECNHAPKKVNIGNRVIQCERGQTIKSLLTWSKQWGVEVNTTRRFMELLKKDKMILTENVVKSTRLTVCKYDSYNGKRIPNEVEKTSKRIPNDFQMTKNNNDIITINKGEDGARPVSPADPFPLTKAPNPKPYQK